MEANKDKLRINIRYITGILPILFILAMFLLHLAVPVRTYSREERRYLQQWPVIHAHRVLDGSYETKIESYFSDQFPFRNYWVHLQDTADRIILNQ